MPFSKATHIPGQCPAGVAPSEWLLASPRLCLHLKSLPQLHSLGVGGTLSLHLRALGDIPRGWRPQGTQGSPLLGNPQIGFWSWGSRGEKHQRTATSSLSALDAAVGLMGSFSRRADRAPRDCDHIQGGD